MDGISSEAASLAGHLKLDCLCWIYDDNEISIEGDTHLTSSDDVAARFLAYHWNVERVDDAYDLQALERAYRHAAVTRDRPSLIIVRSHIGYGAPFLFVCLVSFFVFLGLLVVCVVLFFFFLVFVV